MRSSRGSVWVVVAATLLAGCGETKSKPETAGRTPYDDANAGVEAENVQTALDVLFTRVTALESDLAAANAELAATATALDAAEAALATAENWRAGLT